MTGSNFEKNQQTTPWALQRRNKWIRLSVTMVTQVAGGPARFLPALLYRFRCCQTLKFLGGIKSPKITVSLIHTKDSVCNDCGLVADVGRLFSPLLASKVL